MICFVSNLSAVAVRVLLSEQKKPQWELSSSCGFGFQDPTSGKRLSLAATYHKITVTSESGYFCINGKKFLQDQLYIKPIRKHSLFGGETYDGFFLITKHKKNFLLINVVDSEEYVYSVLKTESWPGWPLEINKVFAVASRSYVMHRLLKARKKGLPYHIKNTNHHQCYNGVHNCAITRKAIQETSGLFLAHGGEPILAMFDICCGGVVPCHINGIVDFDKVPYLARNYACTFCKQCKSYSWEVDYSFDQLRNYLQEGVDEFLHDLKDIKISKDKAGVVQEVTAKTERSEFSFSAHEVYKLLKEVKSFAFTIKKRTRKVVLKGRGFGHHIGLCQWGAREMIRQGWSFESVLQFFYPGTTFMRLEDTKKS